jgi:hypothetical protein
LAPQIAPGHAADPTLAGTWLATLAFPGERPLRAVITFNQLDAALGEEAGSGQWARVSKNQFSASFVTSADGIIEGGAECRVKATLKLDDGGGLKGPLTAEVLDSDGLVVRHLQGVARATRIPQARVIAR